MSKPTRERALFFITTISCGHVMFVKVFSSVYEKKLRLFVVNKISCKIGDLAEVDMQKPLFSFNSKHQ